MSNKKIVVNESKTPLAFAHAGTLRRIFIHNEAVVEAQKKGHSVDYLFGNDDYDPYDYFPDYFSLTERNYYSKYLGHPLSNISAPQGDISYADYHFNRLIDTLKKHYGIQVKTYRTSDLYKSGAFDDYISLVLENIPIINEMYFSITGRKDKFTKCPIQVICPRCGNMRTTHLMQLGRDKVRIACHDKSLKGVDFHGCGYEGWVCPYGGKSRLAWKLEWPMRWWLLGIDIEGGRKDQNTKKGAREFAEVLYQHFFGDFPHHNLAYDFCYLKSNTLPEVNRFGVSVEEIMNFMPPKMIYNLLTKHDYLQPIDIDLGGSEMYDWYKKYLSEVGYTNSDAIITSVIDEARYSAVSQSDDTVIKDLHEKVRYYLRNSTLPQNWYFDKVLAQKASLNSTSVHWLKQLSSTWLQLSSCDEKVLQAVLYEIWERYEVAVKDGCMVLYNLLINRNFGPRAGLLLTRVGRKNFVKVIKEIERNKIRTTV